MKDPIEKTVTIHAPPSAVWKTLTEPALMTQWMGEPEMQIDIQTDWKVNEPFVVSGVHHGRFVNSGLVLEFEPDRKLTYTHLSSVSRLEDKPENYTIFGFTLQPDKDQTILKLQIHNFPTESIYKHLEFYWGTTLTILKDFIEKAV
ncbi:MAG: Activator of Hsp90 ATPase 1 family protein [Bacteroidetes bacterium]|jgi:uncharacterized protein YndB with AHSA1/START domain|nr:Activator of Hsp90 ATPase 1 family protein [Bacteroidota bacterium]